MNHVSTYKHWFFQAVHDIVPSVPTEPESVPPSHRLNTKSRSVRDGCVRLDQLCFRGGTEYVCTRKWRRRFCLLKRFVQKHRFVYSINSVRRLLFCFRKQSIMSCCVSEKPHSHCGIDRQTEVLPAVELYSRDPAVYWTPFALAEDKFAPPEKALAILPFRLITLPPESSCTAALSFSRSVFLWTFL